MRKGIRYTLRWPHAPNPFGMISVTALALGLNKTPFWFWHCGSPRCQEIDDAVPVAYRAIHYLEAIKKSVSASEVNRQCSKLLRDVADGEDVSLVSHGRTVAKLIPTAHEAKRREMARSGLLARLVGQEASGPRDWTRTDA